MSSSLGLRPELQTSLPSRRRTQELKRPSTTCAPPRRSCGVRAQRSDEIGHAILGMCHISAEAIGDRVNPPSLMAASPQGTVNLPSRLTSFDIEAAQAIYGSPLSPGGTRAAPIGAGVVKP